MTQDEVDLLLQRDAQIRKKKAKTEQKPEGRNPSLNKIVNFNMDQTLYTSFKDLAESEGFSVPIILRAAVISYTFGLLKMHGDRLKSVNEALHNTPEGLSTAPGTGKISRETKPVGRPKAAKEVVIEEKPTWDKEAQKKLPWEDRDHANMPIMEYPCNIPEPFYDSRPTLRWDTKGEKTRISFNDLCDKLYWEGRLVAKSDRWWISIGLSEFIDRCARKFLALNSMDLRIDLETLRPGFSNLEESFSDLVALGYQDGHIKDENS